ncbi:MAG: hypothetical protein N2317_01460 [Syntrophales bacterium]|nr:hypothetical protein [Syntrophales bacterium]
MSQEEKPLNQIKMDANNLYREEVITDLKVGNIRQFVPVKANGEIDKKRKTLYFGQTQVITPHGPLPIQFPIDAKNLQQAIEKFPETMSIFIERMVAEARERQREEQHRIIVPR